MYKYILIILQTLKWIIWHENVINMTFKLPFLELIFQLSELKLHKFSVPLNIPLNKVPLLVM